MTIVVKDCVYFDILFMGSMCVVKYTCLRGNPIPGQHKYLRALPSEDLNTITKVLICQPILLLLVDAVSCNYGVG